MSNAFPPALIFIAGAALIPFLKGRIKSTWMLLLPLVGLMNLFQLSAGTHCTVRFLDYDLVLLKVDKLSLVFGYVFHLAAFFTLLFMLRIKRDLQYVAGIVYAGAALGVVFSGDFLSFFIFWELLTVPAVLLILAGGTRFSLAAGLRYLMIHLVGGLVLFTGILLRVHETGEITLAVLTLDRPSSYLIFLGMGVNAAWPLLHSWLIDSYPVSSIGGCVFLSAFTTKTAVYALARTFPGAEPLLWIGAVMMTVPVFYAVIENDLRRVLSYSLINQVGYMMVGIGIGTEMALNGAAAHAFCHIIYKALLFMSIGAVMYRTGKSKATELGGLYKSMPLTCVFCIIGAASISAFPIFSGFVSKALIVEAAAQEHMVWLWFVLLFASAGVFHHAGIKIPFFTFFGRDSGIRVKEAPGSMLLGMGIASGLCVIIGLFPQTLLYTILPYATAYEPYTAAHCHGQLMLLVFSALAFTLLLLSGVYPAEIRATNLDSDWFYRKGCRVFLQVTERVCRGAGTTSTRFFSGYLTKKWLTFITLGPIRITQFFLTPLWAARGLNADARRAKAFGLYSSFSRHAFPIGITCVLTALFVAFLFFL